MLPRRSVATALAIAESVANFERVANSGRSLMGVIRFLLPVSCSAEQTDAFKEAYFSGLDGHVFPSQCHVDTAFRSASDSGDETGGRIVELIREAPQSGKFHIAWSVTDQGMPIVTTCSLIERDAPYLLPLELARGKLNQFREQLAGWEMAGMAVPESVIELNRRAFRQFYLASNQKESIEQASQLANESLSLSFQASEELMQSYVVQRLNARRRQRGGRALLGCQFERMPIIDDASSTADDTNDAGNDNRKSVSQSFKNAFTAAAISVDWRYIEAEEGAPDWSLPDQQVEWCLKNNLIPRGGPLLNLSESGFPEWLSHWQNDYLNLLSLVCNYVETTVSQYKGRIRHWEIASHANTGGIFAFNEEQRLTLIARVLDVARQADEENQIFLRIDQPWGDYQARGKHRLSPYQFVDALLRSGLGLSGISLQLSYGYSPGGCGMHDHMNISRLLDIWGTLGVPLHVNLAFPSARTPDPHAEATYQVKPDVWKQPWSEQAQAQWLNRLLPLLLSKQSVVGIFWNHFSDATPHSFPHSGLLCQDGSFKPAYECFLACRQQMERH